MINTESFNSLLRSYLETTLYLPVADIEDTTLLFTAGYLDSFNMVELVTWLEKTFGVKFGIFDLSPENLDSIERMRNFVLRQTAQ